MFCSGRSKFTVTSPSWTDGAEAWEEVTNSIFLIKIKDRELLPGVKPPPPKKNQTHTHTHFFFSRIKTLTFSNLYLNPV